MAGGIVAFPQHNLQMYVQSVTHTWDYSSGFDTQAELMAPAAMNKVQPGKSSFPSRTLATYLALPWVATPTPSVG